MDDVFYHVPGDNRERISPASEKRSAENIHHDPSPVDGGAGLMREAPDCPGELAGFPSDIVDGASGRTVIIVGKDRRVIVDASVDASALGQVLEVLERR